MLNIKKPVVLELPSDLGKIKFRGEHLQRPYIGDQIDLNNPLWLPAHPASLFGRSYTKLGQPIVLNAPTGSGKTQFILNKLLPHARSQRQCVLIITNRNILTFAYKKAILEAYGIANNYSDEGIRNCSEFGDVTIMNYQELFEHWAYMNALRFSYVICDECHYFLQDASFSDWSGFALSLIPVRFQHAVRLYVSATITQVLQYITRYERDVAQLEQNINPSITWPPLDMLSPDFIHIYTMEGSYEKITLQFYDELNHVVDFLKTQPSKTLAFCDKKEDCAKISSAFPHGIAIDAMFLEKNPDVLNNLVENESFSEDCLAATSVFCNGNNIHDKNVKSVIINCFDYVDLMQMAGRRRINPFDDTDGFTLYLPIPTIKFLKKRIWMLQQKLEKINYLIKNPVEILRIIKDGTDVDSDFIRNVFHVDYQCCRYILNPLTAEKFKQQIKFYEELKSVLESDGAEGYATHIADLFNKPFNSDMFFKTKEARKTELISFIEEYGFPLSQNDFDGFANDFREKRIYLFGPVDADSRDKKRKAPGLLSINNRLSELGIPLLIKKKNTSYVLERKIENEDLPDTGSIVRNT